MRQVDMKRDWNVRAGEDAPKAIACDDAQNEAAFRASGERDLPLVLEGVTEILTGHESVLEIGCGTGRLLEPLARHFGRVFGVEVSGEMVRRGRERLAHLRDVQLRVGLRASKIAVPRRDIRLWFPYKNLPRS